MHAPDQGRIVTAAVALADLDSLEALSMRRLARELGVEAMSLYNHVANREDLLAGIIDLVFTEIGPPGALRSALPARGQPTEPSRSSPIIVRPRRPRPRGGRKGSAVTPVGRAC